jgi:hypothetical protein
VARSRRMSAQKRLRERRKAAQAELERVTRPADLATTPAPLQLTLPLPGAIR